MIRGILARGRFLRSGSLSRLALKANPIQCGLGKWVDGVSNMPGIPPKLTVGDLRPCKVAASGAWRDENTFEMIWHFYETPHSDIVTCHFDGDKVKVEFLSSITQKTARHPEPTSSCKGLRYERFHANFWGDSFRLLIIILLLILIE
jgi:hypothetical protein